MSNGRKNREIERGWKASSELKVFMLPLYGGLQ